MTSVPVEKIKPNPWRNLELYPIDKEQVAKLVQSINQHGFFGGVKARAVNGYYELGCGHHRIEAARQIGLREVNIVVDKMSEDQMIQLMCTENATQSGAIAAAIMNEVSAATKRIAGVIMRCDDGNTNVLGELSEISLSSPKSLATIKQQLMSGDGIGYSLLMRYFGGGDESKCQRKVQQIKDAISALKDSGLYTSIIQEIEAEIKAEAETEKIKAALAEERSKEAEAKATQSANSLRKEADKQHEKSQKADEARQNAKKATKNSENKYSRILDEHCANVFANDFQFAAFKEAVTSEAGKRFIPVNQQLPLAQQLMKELSAKTRDAKRVGAPFIKQYVATVIDQAIAKQSLIDKEEKDRLRVEQAIQAFRDDVDNLRVPLNRIISLGSKILEQLNERPDFANDSISGTIEIKIDEAINTLKSIKKHF